MTTRHRRRIREAMASLEQRRAALVGSKRSLLEAGRVLSAANEDKLRTALSAIDDVLKALDKTDDASKESRSRTLELAEAYSSSATDASMGAYIVAQLLDLMSDESDEPDELPILQVAYNAIVAWMSVEVAEIGSPEDVAQSSDDPYAMYEAVAAVQEAFMRRIRSTAVAVHHTDTSDAEYDAGEHEARLPTGGDDEAALKAAYAYQDPDGDPTAKSSYKFMHHEVNADGSIGPANTRACSNGIAVLNGGRGGADIPDADRQGVYEHLANHLKDAGMDPPELKEAWRAARDRMQELGGVSRTRTRLHEGRRLVGDLTPLQESAVREDGTARIKLIQPGWGSTGYYSPAVLEGAASVFPAGLKMFWDHPTMSEEFERPERSLRDLAGELTSDAVWDPNGPAGAGLYADAKVFSPYRDVLNEIAPSTGVSIVAYGKVENGTAEGKSGALITELVAADSVDYVTTPGAGGQVLSLIEAARQRMNPKEDVPVMEVDKDPKFLEERKSRLAAERLLVERDAKDLVATKLVESQLPESARKRIAGALAKAESPAKDGKLDEAEMSKRIEAAITEQREYLAELTEAGQIRGMGGATPTGDDKETDAALVAAFESLGHTPESAKVAARGRK